MRRHLRGAFPTVLTIGNLLCGFLSLHYIVKGSFVSSAWLIIVAWFLDGFDGKVARLTGSVSRFGVELDSLADLCSFGVAPAFLMVQAQLYVLSGWGMVVGFLFCTCGALRLARFNVQIKGFAKENFTGLPIPSAAVTIASYLLFGRETWPRLQGVSFSAGLVVVLSLLMVSTLEYDAIKFSLDSWWDRCKMAILVGGALAVALFPNKVLFPLSMMYVSSGMVRWVIHLPGSGRAVASLPNQ